MAQFSDYEEGIVRQEIVTYKERDGIMIRTVETRRYQGSDDYIESYESAPLIPQ